MSQLKTARHSKEMALGEKSSVLNQRWPLRNHCSDAYHFSCFGLDSHLFVNINWFCMVNLYLQSYRIISLIIYYYTARVHNNI